ncbi:hypothetical protein GF314_02630 [bacterium]|nr:hypothetical protein [bacterium]
MVTLRIVLHDDLADLVGGRRDVVRRLPAPTSVKDAVEALDIPHVEIGQVALDGRPATLTDRIHDGARIDVRSATPHDLANARFVCDQHLGKLARLLRFCGFDTVWDRSLCEAALALLAIREGRVVLSRHRALLQRKAITSGLLVRGDRADDQLVEVLRRFRLAGRVAGPGRCTACNGELMATAKADVPVPIPPRTAAWLDDYWICARCGKLFWEGTHVERLRRRVAAAAARATAG